LIFLSLTGKDAPAQDAISDTQTFEVLTGSSILRIYVGRAGMLAGMGHNHVIVSRDLSGSITLTGQRTLSSAVLTLPVQALIVDDAQERRRAGNAYVSIPSESDKSATRSNMLGERVLDGETYPDINIAVRPLTADGPEWLFRITAELKDNEVILELPAGLVIENEHIVLDTEFNLDHGDLGLTPYSVLGGILKVADEIGFELHIEATSH
jgi:hypothetical protein